MAAAALLQRLHGTGFVLALDTEAQLLVSPASRLTNADRTVIRAHRNDLVQLLANPAPAVEAGPASVGGDGLAQCLDCDHWRPGRCHNHRVAGLAGIELAAGWHELLQRCRGFREARKCEGGA